MNNEKNDEEEFLINFDDDVVDLTDTNRKFPNNPYINNSAPYDSYDNSASAYNAYNGRDDNDPYGVYNPNHDLTVSARTAYGSSYSGVNEKGERFTFKLMLVAMAVSFLYVMFLAFSKYETIYIYSYIGSVVSLICELGFVVDSVVIKSKYGKTSAIVIAAFFGMFYPLIGFGQRGLRKIIPTLWLLAYIFLLGLAIKNIVPNFIEETKYEKSSQDTYSSKYDTAMKKFKGLKANTDSRYTVYDIVTSFFRNYDWDVKRSSDSSYLISVKGIVTMIESDGTYDQNVTLIFKMNSSMKSFSVTGAAIDGTSYSTSDAQKFWESLINSR